MAEKFSANLGIPPGGCICRKREHFSGMNSVRYIHWQDGDQWIGYLEDYPDYWTQGESFEDLQVHLKDLYKDLSTGQIPCARMAGVLELN